MPGVETGKSQSLPNDGKKVRQQQNNSNSRTVNMRTIWIEKKFRHLLEQPSGTAVSPRILCGSRVRSWGQAAKSATLSASALAVFLLSAGGALLGVDTVMADDWAYWRGPEQNGISREKGLPSSWNLESKKNVLWTSETGGRAAPIILNGRVFLNCRTADNINDPKEKIHAGEQVVCWDLETGKELWRDRFNVFQTDIPAPRVGWASMCGDKETGYVYVHSVSGLFRCYDPDGKVIWEHSLFEDYGKISGYGGRTQSPIIDEDRIIVSFLAANWGASKGPGPQYCFYAFDKKTGELQWVSAPGDAPVDTNYSSPMIRVIDGQRMLIGGGADGAVLALNARTGTPIWKFRMSFRGLNATPVVDGNYVYISHGEDNIDNQEFGRIQCIDARGSGDITETNSVWRVDGLKAGYTGLLVKDDILYVVADTGNLHAYDSKTGKELWIHNLGTVGKGSPVWADDKMYVMEVNGNIHILKPTREGCESLSRVELLSTGGTGLDEIYASPAISNGRVVFVTRDRTICIGEKTWNGEQNPIPPLDEEAPAGEPALLQMRPYEVALMPGESHTFKLMQFDAKGRLLSEPEIKELSAEGLGDGTTAGATFTAGSGKKDFGGTVTASEGGLTASARVITYPNAESWNWNFDEMKGVAVPPSWIRAFVKLKPTAVDDGVAMFSTPGKGRPSHQVHIGPATMSNYTVQADTKLIEVKRKLSSVGLTCQRYNFILKGNNNRLSIQSWAPHLRMEKNSVFKAKPEVWYTMKMTVEEKDGQAIVKGKIWERGQEEPADWTLTATDPHPNSEGSPGLYLYMLGDSYFDNVSVTLNEK